MLQFTGDDKKKQIMLQVLCMKIITQDDELISHNNNHNHPPPHQAVNETEEVIYTLLREKVSRVYNYYLTITKMRFSTLLGHQTRKPNYQVFHHSSLHFMTARALKNMQKKISLKVNGH